MPVSRRRKKPKVKTLRGRVVRLPRATLVLEPEHFELETCPEGFVDLRRMSYGEFLQSNDMAFQVSVEQEAARTSARQGKDPDLDFKVTQAAITTFQMSICITNHNLEDENGNMLNFRNVNDINRLDPRVGQEISSLIDRIHNWRGQYPNSERPSTTESLKASELEMATGPAVPSQELSQTT